jgi:hypothetical protein
MKKVLIMLVCLIVALPVQTAFGQSVRNDQVGRYKSGNGGSWGGWTLPVYCPPGTWAAGYTMRVEPPQGKGDDTALNAVALYCRDRYGNDMGRVSPHPGFWGNWVEGANCPRGAFLTYFRLKVEPSLGSGGDDTAANSVAFKCSTGHIIEAAGGRWGYYGYWQGGYLNAAICGVAAKVEPQQGKGDDTALNDLEFTWCRM